MINIMTTNIKLYLKYFFFVELYWTYFHEIQSCVCCAGVQCWMEGESRFGEMWHWGEHERRKWPRISTATRYQPIWQTHPRNIHGWVQSDAAFLSQGLCCSLSHHHTSQKVLCSSQPHPCIHQFAIQTLITKLQGRVSYLLGHQPQKSHWSVIIELQGEF